MAFLHNGIMAIRVMAKLYFYYASMNAGKSTNLLQAEFNYRERGMATMLWTAALDDRGTLRRDFGALLQDVARGPHGMGRAMRMLVERYGPRGR